MDNVWHIFDKEYPDKKLIKGKRYLICTWGNEYFCAEFTGEDFFGYPLLTKAWAEFERFEEKEYKK